MSTKLVKSSLLATSAALIAFSSSCRSMETTFGAPQAKLESAANIDLKKSLPAPDPEQVALGEIELRINSALLDEEGKRELGREIGRVAGNLRPWTTKDKAPEYRIIVRQVNSAEEWENSGMGAVIGGVAGAGAGAAIDDTSRTRGAITGGAIGAALGTMAFGEQSDKWVFSVALYRKTTAGAVAEKLGSLQEEGIAFSGGAAGDTVSLGSSNQTGDSSAKIEFDSDEYPAFFAAILSVDSGTFHSTSKVENAARRTLVEELPRLIFGGDEISW